MVIKRKFVVFGVVGFFLFTLFFLVSYLFIFSFKESDENEWEEAGPKENEESKHTETRSISIEPTIDTNTTVPKNTPIEV